LRRGYVYAQKKRIIRSAYRCDGVERSRVSAADDSAGDGSHSKEWTAANSADWFGSDFLEFYEEHFGGGGLAAPGPGYDRFLADIKANADTNELLYRSASSKDDVKKAFDDFIVHPVIAEEFVPFGSLGSSFSLINYPGEPRYRASEGTSVEWSGSSFKWYIGTKNAAGIYEVPAADDGVFTLSFYIKLSDAAIKAGGFHAVFNQLGVTYVQYPEGNVLNKNQTTKTYPNVYISSGGEVKEGVTGASDGENANQTTAEAEMTKNTDIETLFSKTEGEKKTESAAMSSVSSPNTSEKPEITKISFGLTPEGKNQVTVSLTLPTAKAGGFLVQRALLADPDLQALPKRRFPCVPR